MFKSIFIRITLLWLATANLQQAFAQKVCDLQFTQIRYQQNQAIPQGDTVWGAVCIKNLGPDTIFPGEPIYIRKSVAQVTNTYNGGLVPGDSIRFKLFSLVNDVAQDSLFSYCFWRGANTTPYIDPSPDNDTVCVTLHLLGRPTGIFPQQRQGFKVYPNPAHAKGQLQIACPPDMEAQLLEFSLYDLNGKQQISTQQSVRQGMAVLHLDEGAAGAGMYFLHIRHKGGLLYASPLLIAD